MGNRISNDCVEGGKELKGGGDQSFPNSMRLLPNVQ